jgi:two-component system, sensor histidine kinase PdtaS
VKYRLFNLLFSVCFIANGQTTCIESVRRQANIDYAISEIEKCISNSKPDTAAYVKNACHLSSLYNKKSRFARSEKLLLSLFSLVKAQKYKLSKALIYNSLANTYKLSHDNALALQNYITASQIFETENSIPDQIRIYTDMAEYFRSIGQYAEARRYIQKAYYTYFGSKTNDIPKLIRIFNRYAAIMNENSNSDSCIIYSLKALKLAQETGDMNSEATSLNEFGFIMKNRLLVDSSMSCYKRAIELWTKTGAEADAVHGMFNLAMLMSHNDFPKKEIIPHYKKIIWLVKEKSIDYPLDQVFFELSSCYFFLGDSLNYYRTRQEYYNAFLEKSQRTYDIEVSNIKEKYENEKYKAQISKVSDELEESEKNLFQKKKENGIIYISLGILLILLVVIVLLARKINGANKVLESKNKEKDTLIQEIHHRVKNNLQFVSSLINMQIHSSKNSAEVDSLNDASRRIRSMALVHEMLYNQDDLKGIEINKYLSELISSINDIVNSQKIPIRFNIECEVMQFETPRAIALGMITSELVSNSIKYAFNGTSVPQIDIRLQKIENDTVLFTVKDNGKGLVADNPNAPEKLGMRLISIFSRQIKGEYSFKNNTGLEYTLLFKQES